MRQVTDPPLHSPKATAEDYRRAAEISKRYSIDKVTRSGVEPRWLGESNCFWYSCRTREGRDYVMVDAAKQKRTPLFDKKTLARQLSASIGKEVNADSLVLSFLEVSATADTLTFGYDGKNWQYSQKKKFLTEQPAHPCQRVRPERHWMEEDDERGGGDFNGIATWDGFDPNMEPEVAEETIVSPDGKYEAYTKNSNVYVRNLATGQERQLSLDGTLGNYYSRYIQWSPDSRKVVATKIKPVEKRYAYYVESSPESQLQPILHKQEYAKPGDELPFRIPCIFDVATGKAAIPSTELFASQYYVTAPQWDADSKGVTFEFNERGHKNYRLLALDTLGNITTVIDESHPKYVNYPRIFRHHLRDGKRILWTSERDNYNHLYLYTRGSDKPQQITKGEWYVRDIVDVDEDNGTIIFTANGVDKDIDPYLIKYYRINLDGSGMQCLTPEEGTHRASLSADKKYLADVYSAVDKAPVATLRSAIDGSLLMTLEEADISALLAEGWKAPEVFVAPGRDGTTPMWGLIQRPSNFDPSKSYPIIEYIYQGPGDQYVPKYFIPCNRYMTCLAELGFIVVMVDGMGTSYRSRDFENICYKNLKDAALPDHIAWLKAAAEKYPYMDIDRVGIYGCSAGGQESTAAVLFHPEFYKCAYSACGCHDNRMDKIWWNELWMGYPVDGSYSECSNVDNAHLLTRPLMLVVGELDDNVDPASTMQVAAALIKANKDFELVVIPGAHHTVGEAFGERKRYDFFVKHLQNATPPAWE
ncbi:MAG: S9 family peptidase [Bacteroidales bacterium]|nr:S9 family peptidase [Bacteroidales bacterium]